MRNTFQIVPLYECGENSKGKLISEISNVFELRFPSKVTAISKSLLLVLQWSGVHSHQQFNIMQGNMEQGDLL
jgi:hypothetical protein